MRRGAVGRRLGFSLAVALAGILVSTLAVSGSARAADAADHGGTAATVEVVAVPDLLWSDLSPTGTPAMWGLLTHGAAGDLSVKARWQLAGCADGLLTLGAGNRAAAEPSSAARIGCTAAPSSDPSLVKANRQAGVGALATSLARAGISLRTQGPGAALLTPAATTTTGDPRVRVDVLDGLYAAPAATRARAATDVDTQVGQVMSTLPAGAVVLLVGSSDGAASTEAHLHVVIADGPGFAPGYLSSPSTQRSPYSELIDVAPTVLRLVGVDAPESMVGRPMSADPNSASASARARRLRDLDTKAVLGASRRPPFMYAVSVLALLVALAGLTAGAARLGSTGRRRLVEAAAYPIAALPAVSWLVQLLPWWRWPALALPLLLLAGALIVGGAAYRLAGARPVRGLWLVCGVSLVVLLGDLLTGTHLQSAALLGDSPITAGRFYGAGNTAFGVLAAAALLAVLTAGAVPPTRPRRTAIRGALVAVVALIAVATVEAAPVLGADVGGGLALFPSVLLGALLLARVRMSVARVVGVLLAGAVPVAAFALWDYHRGPGRRTHIGEFVAQIRDGSAAGVLARKLSANVGQLVSSPFLVLVAGTVVVVIVAVRRQRARVARLLARTPGLAAALVAFTLCAVLGGALNDSGVTVTGIMLSVALPLVTALAMRAEPETDA